MTSGCTSFVSSTGFSSYFSSSLESSAKAKGFLIESRWNFFCYSFSALNPPFTVLIFANSPLNFFFASKGTMLCYLFLTYSLAASGSGCATTSFLGSGTDFYYFYDCSDSDSSSSLEILVQRLTALL